MYTKLVAAAAALSAALPMVAGAALIESFAAAVAHGIGADSVQPSAKQSVSSSDSSACAQIVADYEAYRKANPDVINRRVRLSAKGAYDCAMSVPFVAEDALELLGAAKDYWQFQTTLAYLKNPTSAYQQPPIDVMKTLDAITLNVNAGSYPNQYAFDYNIFILVAATHEEHFNLNAGVVGLFKWSLDEQLVALSSDGKALPKVYNYNDILRTGGSNASYTPSAVKTIGGQDVIDYLTELAAQNQIADIEPHADFNVMMANPAFSFDVGGTLGYPSYFQAGTIYRGENVNGTFENGTSFVWDFHASPSITLDKSLSSGQDVYDNYVLKPSSTPSTSTAASTSTPTPATETATATTTASSKDPGATAIPFPNYPQNPVIVQDEFGLGGTVSGYILDDAKIGVLSLPSFASNEAGVPLAATFSAAVAGFISKAKAANVTKVVIDIQGNGGGTVLQGYDTFKQFFPTTDPYFGFRIRAHPVANTIGSILTGINENVGGIFPAEIVSDTDTEFAGVVSLDSTYDLKEDGQEYESWEDYYGPVTVHGDTFSNNARFNISSQMQTETGFGEFVYGYGNNTATAPQPWAAGDIIILSDGQCGSTCSIFSELMKTSGGVKFVAVGGLPEYGPMQPVAGTRGSNVFPWTGISQIVEAIHETFATFSSEQASSALQAVNLTQADLDALPVPVTELKYSVRLARFNMLDGVRKGSEEPLQFTYEAADCRLFFTALMHLDITLLWRAAAALVGADADFSMCVQGSTGHPTALPNVTSIAAANAPVDNGSASDNGTVGGNTTNPTPVPIAVAAAGRLVSSVSLAFTVLVGALVLLL